MSIDQTTTTTDDRPSDAPTIPPAATAAAPRATVPTPARAPAPARKPGTTFESLAVAGLVFGIFAIVIAVFAVGLAARAVSEAKSGGGGGGGGGASTAPATLDVTLADFSIKPAKAEIAGTGDITIENKGAVDHDLRIENEKSMLIAPGKKSDLQLKGLAPGTYTMYCDVPGHRAAGMEGTIVVK